MILFFGNTSDNIFAVQTMDTLGSNDLRKLVWLFGDQPQIVEKSLSGTYIGPRAAMITPWSTNAVEITQNMAISGIVRIEKFIRTHTPDADFDPMLFQRYEGLDQEIFLIRIKPEPLKEINDIAAYNQSEGLSLSTEEIDYLYQISSRLGRYLTDSEVFGFSQVNSEHCRHKIFNGTFIIDGEEQPASLFSLIKQTSKLNPNAIVSAYKDNVAFLKGPVLNQFAPRRGDHPDFYEKRAFESVLSLKAETHNFPTTVEPFNGAATGSGGEIRDRLAGGKGSIPLGGTAVYMTAYSRLNPSRKWENGVDERPWLYQTPQNILIKASNGASDFGNKFGQPLVCGSLFTFEHEEHDRVLGYDKVIMLAGGIGYGKATDAQKEKPKIGDRIIVLGGDNYRIGMGGAAVSSVDTGEFSAGIELNAVQRSNPEMQKRVANTIRTLVEESSNPIILIHDHGAGGHLNCFSEMVEDAGGIINIDKLPIGDPTLSLKEIIGNESQERMGLVIGVEDLEVLKRIAERERAPWYDVGEITGDQRFVFTSASKRAKPIDLNLTDLFGSSPKTILRDTKISRIYQKVDYDSQHLSSYLEEVLRLEAVACKDWLTNKVDRCVGGLVAKQQCVGPLQLPLNNCGVMALDYDHLDGLATSIGHAPASSLIHSGAGARNALAEALTNLIWAPLENGLSSVSLSANWMWPCKNAGEDARLYEAVEALSSFAIALGINVPTGKDSLSMKQKYPDGEVIAPGTVVVSAAGHCQNINQIVEPVFQKDKGSIYYINFSHDDYKLGGSSFAQIRNKVGIETPDIKDPSLVIKAFNTIQNLIKEDVVVAGHDISAGGMLIALLEMCFADMDLGANIDLSPLPEKDLVKLLFSENAGIVLQGNDQPIEQAFNANQIPYYKIGEVNSISQLVISSEAAHLNLDIPYYRDIWYETSYLLDRIQTTDDLARARFDNYKKQPLKFRFPNKFSGNFPIRTSASTRPVAAVLREKGSNSERELAHALYLAGFEVKDVHMTDLISGRETLENVRFLGAVGGFSNSDVLGSAKGWAGAFLYNAKAKRALENFFKRADVLSIGICNGCQLFVELGLINPEHQTKGKMDFNDSYKHESAFTSVKIGKNNSVMLSTLEGTNLGVWISHGEGKFVLPLPENQYNIVAKYGYSAYPSNPNGSDYNTAMMCNPDGRHLITMPHIERSIFPWNWAHYPKERTDNISPWIQAFVNARKWLEK